MYETAESHYFSFPFSPGLWSLLSGFSHGSGLFFVMKKDAYYFPHDSNAKDDPKCMLLIDQLGLEGYGIFWVLVELLRDQPGYRYSLELVPAIGKRYNTSTEKVKAVISKYGLFEMEDDVFFFSESLRNRMLPLDTKRQKLSEAGKRGNLKRWGSDRVAIAIREEESKVDKSKTKNITRFKVPEIEIVTEYFIEKGSDKTEAEKYYYFYSAKGWMVGKNKMKDWKAAASGWISRNKPKEDHNAKVKRAYLDSLK